MVDLGALLDDLRAEGDELDALAARHGARQAAVWATPTPATGWTVAHQIAHLAWTDAQALLAATGPDAFARVMAQAGADPDHLADTEARRGAARPVEQLLADWRQGRSALLGVLAAVPDGSRIPWFGPPMSAASMATARIMETWAHGQDVADALGVRREPTDRLRHVARLGVRARDYAYRMHGLPPPAKEFRVELGAPAEEATWSYGPAAAAQRVTGPALDFCLLVTRRRHRDDLALRAEGPEADRWLDIAQAFAGPPGAARRPGQFG